MNRIERLQAILIHLQSKKVVTANELADRFNLSIRTIYRDIRALEEAGVPIGSEAGIGYFLSESYHLAPISFTNDEASAMLIGAKFVEQMSDSHTGNSYRSAMFKIRAVLNTKEKETLDALQDNIQVFGRHQQENCREKTLLSGIQHAIITKTSLAVEYHAFYSNENTTREVEPIGMVFYANAWHLIGFCLLRNDYRDFKIDRIVSIRPTDNRFSGKAHIDLEEYFSRMKQDSEIHKVVIRVRESTMGYIHDSKYWYGFTYEEDAGNQWRRLFFRNGDMQGFARWVLMSGGDAIVEEPESLKELVITLVNGLRSAYDCNS